ncbi:MAG: hypothetical protein AAF518_06095 [Spirochaetota bacterium]
MTQEEFSKLSNIEKASDRIKDRILELKLRRKGLDKNESYAQICETIQEMDVLAQELLKVAR